MFNFFNKTKVIFISGRFRSGTSMLWNIFNQLPNYCTWYEPLHPNLLKHIQYVTPKEDHIGIEDYWGNYRNFDETQQKYSSNFGQNNLYLEAMDQCPDLKAYIQLLIDSSGNKTAVLQFNRMDLRLAWLKNNFPNSIIINIERDPYNLWISSRKHIKKNTDKVNESYPDAYDLLQWSIDLAQHFPMLQKETNRSSYYRHFFIWKLSQKIAASYADIRLKLEDDFFLSNNGISMLAKKLKWSKNTKQIVQQLIVTPNSQKTKNNKGNSYNEIETQILSIFQKTGLETGFPLSELKTIKSDNEEEWRKYPYQSKLIILELLDALKYQKDELTALVN